MYCANCGAHTDMVTICPHCCLDPKIPEAIIEHHLRAAHLDRGKGASDDGVVASAIEYPGERTSLLFSIALLAFLIALLGTLTFGLFIVLLGFAIVSVRLQETHARASLITVGDGHYGHVAQLAKVAAFRLDVPLPEIYIEQQIEPNAHTSGFWRHHWIVLHSSLLDLCTPDELLFVIGHEMGHIKRQHTSWLVLTSPRSALSVPLVRELVTVIFNSWLLRAEYSADRAGLVACRSVDTAVSALIRLQYWDKPADIERLRANWRTLEGDALVDIGELFEDHPHLPHRVEQLESFGANLRKRAIL